MNLSDESAANATNGKHPPTPFNIDGEPITYDGNPAHVEGILHELSEWTARTGHYVTLLEKNAVLLPNGKMAVDSIAAVLFVSGEKDDGGKYSFHTPCPATSERIKKFDAEAARTSSATFTPPHRPRTTTTSTRLPKAPSMRSTTQPPPCAASAGRPSRSGPS